MICTKLFLFLAWSSIYNEYIAIVNLYMAERVANITDQMTKTILLHNLEVNMKCHNFMRYYPLDHI